MLNLKPVTRAITVTATNNAGVQELVDVTQIIAESAANMTTPSCLELISNNRAVDTTRFADVVYVGTAKSAPTVIYKSGKLIKNPAELTKKTLNKNAVQISPCAIADKYELKDIDKDTGAASEKELADKIIDFADALKKENERIALNNMAYAAVQFQAEIEAENSAIKTFAAGAHVEYNDFSGKNSDKIPEIMTNAFDVVERIGLATAKTEKDANFKFARGISLDDVAVICRSSFKQKIAAIPGMLSSDKGFEALTNNTVTSVYGVPLIVSNQLPDDVNFIIATTGRWGAFAFHKLAQGDSFYMGQDQEWHWNTTLQCKREQVMGVVYPQLLLVSLKPDTTIEEITEYGDGIAISKCLMLEEQNYSTEGKKSKFIEATNAFVEKITGSKETETKGSNENPDSNQTLGQEQVQAELNRIKEKQAKKQQLSKVEIEFLKEHETK